MSSYLVTSINKTFQVSESKETKMNISNLARTIGITVVGYSCTDPSADEIMRAVRICIFCK